jgi:hypothetical protein
MAIRKTGAATGQITEVEQDPPKHEPWCGDASLSRPAGKCTCDVTPEQQAAGNRETLRLVTASAWGPGDDDYLEQENQAADQGGE